MLMKSSQYIFKKNKAHNHIKKQWAKILKTLTLMKLEQKWIQNNWRPIYEVLDEAYFIGSKIFSNYFIKECKDNSNEALDILCDVKNNIKWMAMEQGLYTQVTMLRREDLKFVATDKIKNESKFKF